MEIELHLQYIALFLSATKSLLQRMAVHVNFQNSILDCHYIKEKKLFLLLASSQIFPWDSHSQINSYITWWMAEVTGFWWLSLRFTCLWHITGFVSSLWPLIFCSVASMSKVGVNSENKVCLLLVDCWSISVSHQTEVALLWFLAVQCVLCIYL